jgi:amino acid adenylation domain-containing protein
MESISSNAVGIQGTAENLRDFMLATARSDPRRPAVVELTDGDRLATVSYGQLDQQVTEYAAVLDDLGMDIGDRVVVESDTSAAAIAAMLACASLGLAFIPANPEWPAMRLRSIIDAARPAMVLRAAGVPAEAADAAGLPVEVGIARFDATGLRVVRPAASRERYRHSVLGTDAAYIIFTSGTTGRPKGVVMSHRANIAFYRGVHTQDVVAADDRVAVCSPFHFDLCLGGIGLTLSRGATVVPVPKSRLGWPRLFVGFLQEAEVTHVQGVPSIWRAALRHEPEMLAELSRVRRVLFSGEEFPLQELRHLQQVLPGRRIMNCYGATESMACSVTDVPEPIPDDMERLSVGFALAGAEMTIHDEAGRPITGTGQAGEIYLRSPALFSGYWDDPEATRGTLVADPVNPASGQLALRTGDLAYRGPGGEFYFCGRADFQVQVRGNRVELGEVERRIQEYPGVTGAIAALPGVGAGAELIAFVAMRPDAGPVDVVDLRAFCLAALPDYMAPRHLHIMNEFPVTDNGKVDRRALLGMIGSLSAARPGGGNDSVGVM